MLNQNFLDVFVSNNPNLLAVGTTTDLAPGQIGIFDGERYTATTSPAFPKNRGIVIAQGTPDLSDFPKGAGLRNETAKVAGGKSILASKITEWQGKKARKGQTMKIVIGFDGINRCKTLSGKCGQVIDFFLKLTGKPIENLLPGGIVKHYAVQAPECDSCEDGCETVSPEFIADELIKQINQDNLIAGIKLSKYIKVSKIVDCLVAPTGTVLVDFDLYTLDVADDGSSQALGLVQSSVPQYDVKVKSRIGNITTYEIAVPDTIVPPAFVNPSNAILIPDCPVCPSGYTLVNNQYVYKVTRNDAGTAGALTTLTTDYAITGTESANRLAYNFGESTYVIESSVALIASGADVLTLLSDNARNQCVRTGSSSVAWVASGGAQKAQKTFSLIIADDVCGNDFLSELQAMYEPIYGVGSVTMTATDAANCTHQYAIVVSSDLVFPGCGTIPFNYTLPQAFKGIDWTEVPCVTPNNGTDCVAGVLIESAFVHRTTDKCYYDLFPYEVDGIHIEISNYNPDYHGDPNEVYAPSTVLQEFEYPSGSGEYVIRMEEKAQMMRGSYYSRDLALRQAEGTELFTDPQSFYDEYRLVFEVNYSVLGWSDTYTDKYEFHAFYPTGTGKAFERGINSFIASGHSGLAPVIL